MLQEAAVKETLMATSEVARILEVSPTTVRALTNRGELHCQRVGKKRERRFSTADVDSYLKTRIKSVKSTSPKVNSSTTAVLNNGLHIHDWYMMPEAYSEPLILDVIDRFGIKPGETILDPFLGTGTTAVASVLRGINSVGLEINPYLHFAASTKLNWNVNLKEFEITIKHFLRLAMPLVESLSVEKELFTFSIPLACRKQAENILERCPVPEMPRLNKWMAETVVKKVLVLRFLIETEVAEPFRPYFLLALGSILRPVSNMKLTPHAFGSSEQKIDAPVYDLFAEKISKIYADLKYIKKIKHCRGKAQIIRHDARLPLRPVTGFLPASLALTSPPYLNNLDYTMQTRMELFFLNFICDMTHLRQLRKSMIISDAKAMYKDVLDAKEVENVQSIQNISRLLKEVHTGKNWGWDYAFMTTQYFGGMFRVLKVVKPLLKPDAHFVLIVGESAHSGIKVPLPDIIAELGERAGYKVEAINVLRKRRSSSHQFELSESEVILQN